MKKLIFIKQLGQLRGFCIKLFFFAYMWDMSNGMPLRVIRRIEKTVWCIPVTRFSEDMTKHKRVKNEARSRQVGSIYLLIWTNILVQIIRKHKFRKGTRNKTTNSSGVSYQTEIHIPNIRVFRKDVIKFEYNNNLIRTVVSYRVCKTWIIWLNDALYYFYPYPIRSITFDVETW